MEEFRVRSDKIVEILEDFDEQNARVSQFENFAALDAIQRELQIRTGELVPSDVLKVQLDDLWRRGEIVKLKGATRIGYRSRIGEILRYLYKLKLWTIRAGKQRIYEDVSQLKYTRVPKLIPARIRPVEQLFLTNPGSFFGSNFIRSRLENPFDVDPVEVVMRALKKSRFEYANLSDFQLRSLRVIANEWLKDRSNSVVITAPTGAGKTLAFLVSPLIFCVADLLRSPTEHGTKLMLVYPRNALALNQSQLIQELVYQINDSLTAKFAERGLRIAAPQLKEPLLDFRGILSKQGRTKLEAAYQQPPEIVITNTETLKRRIMDRVFHSLFPTLRCVVFDEIHIYDELHGTNIIYLIRRIKASARRKTGKDLLTIGSSATVAQPGVFAKTLFSSKDEAIVLMPREGELSSSGKEHHVFLRPYMDRPPLSVAIDATSCILHNNRKGGLAGNKQKTDAKAVEKAIAFADSLDVVNRWRSMLGSNEKAYRMAKRFSPNYARFSLSAHDKNCCESVMTADGINAKCPTYRDGRLWLLMTDNPRDNFMEVENRKIIKLDAIWSKAYTSKTEYFHLSSDIQRDLFGFMYPPPQFADLVIATTALEVGVDFDNVKEIILHRALKSPASYRQRAGRGGREIGSTSLIATVVSQLPRELYYFRHFTSLVTPSFQPIPIKDLNIEVIRNHLFCALFDLAASEGLNLWNVLGIPDLNAEIESAKKLAQSSKTKEQLRQVYPDDALIEEAVRNFNKALDMVVSSDVFEWLGTRGSFVEVVSNLYRKPEQFRAVETSADNREQRIGEALNSLSQIRIKRTECFDSLQNLDKYPDLQKEFFELLSEIEMVIR